jgi:hypothetical protein
MTSALEKLYGLWTARLIVTKKGMDNKYLNENRAGSSPVLYFYLRVVFIFSMKSIIRSPVPLHSLTNGFSRKAQYL